MAQSANELQDEFLTVNHNLYVYLNEQLLPEVDKAQFDTVVFRKTQPSVYNSYLKRALNAELKRLRSTAPAIVVKSTIDQNFAERKVSERCSCLEKTLHTSRQQYSKMNINARLAAYQAKTLSLHRIRDMRETDVQPNLTHAPN